MANMRVRCDSTQVEYTSRRHTGRGQAHIVIRRGSPLEIGERERFLTARFRLYTILAGRLAFAKVEHAPWPLESAELLTLDQDVIQHSNVPAPNGEPLVYHSPTLSVRVGRPEFLR